MAERPYARYTREKTWQALYSQSINACYALVPNSATNNSIWMMRCKSPEETQERMRFLLNFEQECAAFFVEQESENQTAEKADVSRISEIPTTPEQARLLAYLKNAGEAVVLARSSDYWHYHLADDKPALALVVCGFHDSYLHLPVWETRTNKRYAARETALKIDSPEFEQARGRGQQLGHSILLGALAAGDQNALAYLKKLPKRTQRRLRAERDALQSERYRGRPLAFYTEAQRQVIGQRISDGLIRYHARKRAG